IDKSMSLSKYFLEFSVTLTLIPIFTVLFISHTIHNSLWITIIYTVLILLLMVINMITVILMYYKLGENRTYKMNGTLRSLMNAKEYRTTRYISFLMTSVAYL